MAVHAHQRPEPLQLVAAQFKLQLAIFKTLGGIYLGQPHPVVPNYHVACTVLLGWNQPFKIAIRQRVIFNLHGHAFDMRVQARPLRHRPAF